MIEVTITHAGISSKEVPWARVEAVISGFKLTGFVHPESPVAVGKQMIPTQVYAAIQWQA